MVHPIPSLLTGERETVAELVPHIPTREELHEQAAREKFVNNVYAILAVSLTITVANGMLTLLFVSSTMESHYAEALSTVVYLSILLTFFFWVIISFVCHCTTLDYTVHKLFIWCFQLVWLFVFALLFTLSGMGSYIIAWSTLGLVVNLLALLVDTQMIIGGAKLWRKFDTSQLILATLTLFWDLLMIFVLQMPLLGSLITMIMGYFEDF